MLGDGGDTSSGHELLSMVKKHSNLIGKTIVEVQDASYIEMDPRFWHDVMDLYFVRGKESRGRQDDDLIFFVRKVSSQGYGFKEYVEDDSPYFVRRWAPKLGSLVGDYYADVDWRRSFYLNLIAHTTFSVTVAICSHQDLRNYQSQQNTSLSPMNKVVKTVYASPSRINFHLDSKKEVETTPAYPDICFAVDDFDSTFDAMVLTDTAHCYCVLLNAHDGAAFPSEKVVKDCSPNDTSSLRIDTTFEMTKKTKLTLFSGFVSYQMVRDAYDAGKSQFGSIFSLGQYLEKTDRIYMKGPGGRGEVEVAVSGVADQSQRDTGPFSPIASKKGFGIGSTVAAKQAYAAAAAGTSYYEEMVPLKCCLMSISIPWEHIAYDLLFKAFIIASAVTEEEMFHWNLPRYREHVVWTDKNLTMKLLKEGIVAQITAPMVITQSLKEAGILSSVISVATQSGKAKEQFLNTVESSNSSSTDAFGKIFSENDTKRVVSLRIQGGSLKLESNSLTSQLSLHYLHRASTSGNLMIDDLKMNIEFCWNPSEMKGDNPSIEMQV